MVELDKLGHKDDPFILASQARQVFYMTGLEDNKKSIVVMMPPKSYRDAYESDDEEYSITILPYKDKYIMSPVDKLDLATKSRNDYFRSDCKGKKYKRANRSCEDIVVKDTVVKYNLIY